MLSMTTVSGGCGGHELSPNYPSPETLANVCQAPFQSILHNNNNNNGYF